MADYSALDSLKIRLDSLRPIDPEKLRAVREKFRLEWTYHSNALEGNPLSLSETSFFIREGLTSKGKPLSAYLETSNHFEALEYLDSVVQQKSEITAFLLREYHAMLFKRIDKIAIGSGPDRRETTIVGGEYKRENNHVIQLDGKILEFTDALQVPGEIEALSEWYSKEGCSLHPIDQAAIFHHRFVRIHPFLDGNGRVARLMMNTILMQQGFTPAIIPVEEKQRYLEALQAADSGDYGKLLIFLEEQVAKTMQLTIDVIEGRDAFDFNDLARLARNLAERTKSIEADLGEGNVRPQERADKTGGSLRQQIIGILQKHANEIRTSISAIVTENMAFRTSASFQRQKRLTPSLGTGGVQFAIGSGGKRFVPNGQVVFYIFTSKYQIAILADVFLGEFNANNQEEVKNIEPISVVKLGSIYAEDWDVSAVEKFVLEALKSLYYAWDKEMARRKVLISAEESEVEKYRKI